MSADKQESGKDVGADLGRKAGKLLKTAGPRARKLLEQSRPRIEQASKEAQRAFEKNRPKLEQAGKSALRYAQEHEDQIRATAMKGVRMRLGPLGYVIDAIANDQQPSRSEQPQGPPRCPSCQTENALSARFCSQCGAEMPLRTDSNTRGGNQ